MNMQVEEEREEGRCPFPCNLSSLLSMNCRAKAQSLACRLQTQVRYKNSSGTEETLLVGSDGKVRLASSECRAYSLDDYNLELFHKNAELKRLRPIHVVTSEPTLHLCLPPHTPVREEQSPIEQEQEQEQDSDVYYDFDLVTPPEDYACSGDSRAKSEETLVAENEKQDRPESGCVTSVASPIMFSVDMDLPPSNAPSPVDVGALEDISNRTSDVDLETVRQILETSQNKIDNTSINASTQFLAQNENRPDFIGVVKSSNFLKTSSGSDISSSSASDSELSSDGSTNIPDDEKELLSKEKNMLRNMSYYLPPPSSYQILHNRESDADGSEKSGTPNSKHKTRTKCKNKKSKTTPSTKNESSESRDSPHHPHNQSSSPESSSVHSITLREFNKPPRHLFIRSKSVEEIPAQSPSKIIKTSHSFEKCGCDIYPCNKERSPYFEIKKDIRKKFERTTSNIKNKDNKYIKKFDSHSLELKIEPQIHNNCINPSYNELEAKEIKAKLEIEGGFAVSPLNEEEILQEINEAISILKKDTHTPDSFEEKLAKYEANDCDIFGTKPKKNENCSKQVAVASHDSTSNVTNQCQNLVSVSQLCDVCEEVPYILGKRFTDEKCDIIIKNKVRCNSSYEDISPNSVFRENNINNDMPRSKGRSKVKKVNSDTHCARSQKAKELPETSTCPNDLPPGSSTSDNCDNIEWSELKEPNNFVLETHTPYLSCECNNVKIADSLNCVENEVPVCNDTDLCNQKSDSECLRIHENHIDSTCDQNFSGEGEITYNHDARTFKNCSNNLSDESVDACSFTCYSSALNNSVNFNEKCDKIFSNGDEKMGNLNKVNHNNNTVVVQDSHNTTVVNNFKCVNSDESSYDFNTETLTFYPKNTDISCNVVEKNSKNEPLSQTLDDSIFTTKTTTINEIDRPYVSLPESEYSGMNPNLESDSYSNFKSNCEQDLLEEILDKESNNEDFSEEIELLPSEVNNSDERGVGKEEEDEESDEEILLSSRFKNVANYSEKITRLSEDDGLPPPPTEVILIDYNEPIEASKEEVEEKQNVTAEDLETELNRLSFDEPTVQGPSDESERSSEEREIDLDKQLRIKRSSSLRCGKTPPGTPGRKKIVRFADALGLDLADVRMFLDGVPNVPKCAFDDLRVENDGSAESQIHHGLPSYGSYTAAASAAAAVLQSQAERILTPMFQQPGALPDFYDRLREQKVVLENVSVGNDLSVRGVVRVINEAFQKKVYIRYTFDHWRNYHEATASYVDASCDGFSDRFSFLLWGSFLQSNGSLIFCVKYCVNNEEYWDSNRGSNYVLHCYSAPPVRTLHGKPQNDHSIHHNQENQVNQLRQFPPNPGNPARCSGNFSSFVDSPNTPTDPWVARFF